MSDVGGPPAGFPAPPPWSGPPTGTEPRPRRRRRWPWVLGGVLVLIIGLGATGGTLFVQKIKPPIDATNAYLGDLANGDYQSAFDQLCEQSQADGSPELFESDVADDDALGALNSFEVDPFDVSLNGDRATVGVDLSSPGFDIEDVLQLRLRKEGGEWRPCGGFYGFTFNL